MKNIDARGMMCPGPVIAARKELMAGEDVFISVDNDSAVENLRRLGESMGLHAEITGQTVKIYSGQMENMDRDVCIGGNIYLFADDKIGGGDEKLGKLLLKMAIYTIANGDELPCSIIFINAGVRVVCSESAHELKEMENKGVRILVCGTCADYYDIKGSLPCGTVSNMYEILGELERGSRVIRL